MIKKLLMLNASEHEIPFILAARKLGYYVITTSTKPDYPGHKYADEYIYSDYNDYVSLEELCKKLKIDAISHGCTDDCALAAAYVGEKLGLKGHDSYENALIIHRKDKFKEFSSKYNVLTPKSFIFEQINEAESHLIHLKLPVIIKPVDLAGGQGVQLAKTEKEYKTSIANAFVKSKSKRIIVENFIEGELYSLNTFIINQKVKTYCVANDYSFKNPYLTNTGLTPVDNSEKATIILIPEVERIAKLLNLVDGQLHMQYIMSDNGPVIIEMMRRNIGNNWSTMLTDSIGVNWPEWIIRAESGMNCSSIPNPRIANGYYGYHSMMANENGVFDSLKISSQIEPYIYQVTLWMNPGDHVTNYLEQKVGNLIFHFPSLKEKNSYLSSINNLVEVIIEKVED
jgi:biotin carboxylase